MKKLIATLTLTAALAAVPAFAGGKTYLQADIPFDFIVAGKTLPAGSYQVLAGVTNETVQVRSLDGKHSAITIAWAGGEHNGTSSLAFRVVKGQRYLASVQDAGGAREFRTGAADGGTLIALAAK